jgi:hypothetical protein
VRPSDVSRIEQNALIIPTASPVDAGRWAGSGTVANASVPVFGDTTLHHIVDVLLKAGQRDLAQELWHELRDRPGYISHTQRSALQTLLGEQREPTLTDDQILAWSREIAGRLAAMNPSPRPDDTRAVHPHGRAAGTKRATNLACAQQAVANGPPPGEA